MDEIEKLYKNAGIKKIELDYPDNFDPFYPEFTPEKELKLIKWFIHSRHFCPISFYVPWLVDNIAENINFLWDFLTDKEKKQIKEILERGNNGDM